MDKKTQQQIDELNEALATGSHTKNTIQGGIVDIDLNVDYVEVELLQLPVVSTSVDYLYRFVKPVALVLSREPIRIAHRYGASGKSNLEVLEQEILNAWKESFGAGQDEIDALEDGAEKDVVNKLFNLSKVKIHYLDLVRK